MAHFDHFQVSFQDFRGFLNFETGNMTKYEILGGENYSGDFCVFTK